MPQARKTHCSGGCGRLRLPGPDFFRNNREGGTRPMCKHCTTKASQAWNRRNPEKHREIYRRANHRVHLRRRFGISVAEFDKLTALSDGKCEICRRPESRARRLSLDHDHLTGELRGFLCSGCNLIIGRAKDNPQLLESAARYLREPPLRTRKAG